MLLNKFAPLNFFVTSNAKAKPTMLISTTEASVNRSEERRVGKEC